MSEDLVAQPQMCTVDDLIGGEPCPRGAQHIWHPDVYDHPVYLCNFHAEPFAAIPPAPDGPDA